MSATAPMREKPRKIAAMPAAVAAQTVSEVKQHGARKQKNKSNVFEIVTLINSNYSVNDPKYKDYTMIMKNSGFVYLAKVNKSSDIDINIQTLKDMIKVY